MKEIICLVIGIMIGGTLGITTMCLFQINQTKHMRKEETKDEKDY